MVRKWSMVPISLSYILPLYSTGEVVFQSDCAVPGSTVQLHGAVQLPTNNDLQQLLQRAQDRQNNVPLAALTAAALFPPTTRVFLQFSNINYTNRSMGHRTPGGGWTFNQTLYDGSWLEGGGAALMVLRAMMGQAGLCALPPVLSSPPFTVMPEGDVPMTQVRF
jgi:hypothetical protein